MGFWRLWRLHESFIADISSHLKCIDPGEAEWLLDAVGQVGVVEDDVEAEGLGAQGDGRADAAQPHDAQRVAADARAARRRLAHLFRTCTQHTTHDCQITI